jgi:hypothetical protein
MSELLKAGGLGADQMQRVQVSDLPFVIDRGRLRYSNFTLTFGEAFDLRFSGSVYFDDRLEMTVSVPVRAALLEKLGAKGSLRDYARLLEGARLDIPIRGTRQKPELDWKGVNYLPLLQRAFQAYLAERAAEALKPKGPPTQPATQPAAPPATQPATRPAKAPEQEVIDKVLDLLRGL